MIALKLTTIGNATGVVLPQEMLDRLQLKTGDMLYVIETPNGIELIPYNPNFARQIETAERVIHEDRDALHKLAK